MTVPFVVLLILDGWGYRSDPTGNSIATANTPNMDRYWAAYPHTTLSASGKAVGLPAGEAGNTETGHLNLGAGRIVYQDLLRINMSIADDGFYQNTALLEAINHAKHNSSNLHIMGLIGAGGVHSNIEHLFAILELCKKQKFDRVYLHLFTDGRDSPPQAADHYIDQINSVTKKLGLGRIATIIGRYWAMDRDFRWDRVEKAYRALTEGVGKHATDPKKAVEESYAEGVTDEFINPIIITKDGIPLSRVCENDAVIFYNFRIDRPRELTRAFVLDDFEHDAQKHVDFDPYSVEYSKSHLVKIPDNPPFKRGDKIKNLFFVTMTEYDKTLNSLLHVAFPPVQLNQTLGEILSTFDMRQLRISESEKERFVTFYFNGQRELTYWGEEHLIIPSKKVKTYDLEPAMSAREITEAFFRMAGGTNTGKYGLVLINFANADMVGHTGNIDATRVACEVVDECVGLIAHRVGLLGGVTLITADHGNAEQMSSTIGGLHTEHTTNPVPFLAVGPMFLGKQTSLESGILADVAPTVLKLLGLKKPNDMTGRSLL